MLLLSTACTPLEQIDFEAPLRRLELLSSSVRLKCVTAEVNSACVYGGGGGAAYAAGAFLPEKFFQR
jgi:hypothetical protein